VIAELSVEPRGRLRLSAPVAMASSNLADLLPRFLERHPQVQLEILLTNRRVDLLNEGVDVALRVRELGDEDPALVCRRLAPATTQILAAPSLIAGRRLEHPEDLEDLPFLGAIHND
ncbi:LysR family transcriptional regulator, partial [Pseudomonas aeruginosa]